MTDQPHPECFFLGLGGIGSGMFVALRGDATLGRNESRAGTILRRRDFCKLHIVAHYIAAFTRREAVDVVAIGKVGDDDIGRKLREQMVAAGVFPRFVSTAAGAPTLFSVCLLYPDGDGGNVTTDDSASSLVSEFTVESAVRSWLASRGPEAFGPRHVAAALPEVPLPARRRLLELARRYGWTTAAAVTTGEVAEAIACGLFALTDLLGLNRDEAAAMADMDPTADAGEIAAAAGRRLAEINPAIRVCITAGAEGSFGWAGGKLEHTPAPDVPVINTAGAGDATLAGLIVATMAGLPFIDPARPARKRLADAPLTTACDFAALLAGLAVGSADTINFDADPAAAAALAARLGTDVTALAAVLDGNLLTLMYGWHGQTLFACP